MNGTAVKVEYRPSPAIARFFRTLSGEDLKQLDNAGAQYAAAKTRAWLKDLGTTRHATAQKLGATPTQIVERTRKGVKVADVGGAQCVVIPHPLFRRAYRDVTIAPVTASALAIPVHRLAYGRSPRTIAELFLLKADGKAFLAKSEGKRPKKTVLYYLLHRGRIEQAKDETLLPSENTLALSARAGVSRFLTSLFLSQPKGKP